MKHKMKFKIEFPERAEVSMMYGMGSHLRFSPNKLCWLVRAPTHAPWSPATAVEGNGDVLCQWQIGQLMYHLS